MINVLSPLVRGYALWDRSMERFMWGAKSALRGYLDSVLTPDERIAITVQLYASASNYGRSDRGLYDWEQSWFQRVLPSPPAKILVGAAGAGREVAFLIEAGYDVDAFEPVSDACEKCRAILGGRGQVVRSTYGELVRGGGQLGRVLQGARYDAVLLGWSSLSHVFGLKERKQLLQRCAELAPRGPILASFMMTTPLGDIADRRAGRAERLGRAVGELHASLRGVDVVPEPIVFGSRFGLACLLSAQEIEALGTGIGRKVVWGEAESYPHAAFVTRA